MSNIDIAQGVLEAWEKRDAAKMASQLSDRFVLTGPAPVPLNKDAFLLFMAVHNEGFPNWKFNARDWHADGDTVTCVTKITATHSGLYDVSKLGVPVPALPASGKSPVWGDDHFHFTIQGNQVVALEIQLGDQSGMMGTLAQLGVQLP